SDSVIVGGNAFFQSRFDQSGKLTAGVLRIGQNMTVRRDPEASPRAFVAEGTHQTVFNNPALSTVDVENPTATDSRFQNVEVLGGGNLEFVSGAHISGNLDVTGSASINANLTLNVRGLLTTSAGSGMGIDTLVLGDPGTIAPGSGFINARVWVLDAAGPQTMPAIPAPAGADSASLIVRSQTGFTSNMTLRGLRIEGDGLLEINEQAVNVFGDFATADNGRLFMQYPLSRLTITGATTFGGGSTLNALTAGILTTSGRFTQVGTNSPTSFRAIGDHITRIATNYPGGNIVSFTTPPASGFQNLELSVPVTWASDIEVYNDFTNTASAPMSAGRFAVRGSLTQSGNSTFTPRKLVFHGPAMNVSNGSLAPDTVEFRQNPLSFVLPVGEPRYFWNHMLMRENANVRLGAASPALTSLDMSEGSVLELNNIGLAIGGTFTATPGTVVDGGGGGGVVVAQRFQVNGLTVENGRLELIEGGIPETQQLDNVTFQGLTSLGPNALLTVTGAGNNGTPRSLTFNAVNFPVISDGLYARLTSSNAANFNLVLAGSNRVAEGPAASNPANGARVAGALIDWQP
ncbi:MAG TPA: hypothetical protein VG817_09650, partial [Gemmatimonadales bacterium]|nr:hypothetical protein [Gemmatimonadales bacterium]